MSSPFVGEIRLFAGNFEPSGWAFCNGQLLAISQNDVLFSLIGTTYGGDGQNTFAVPDLRGRVPLHAGSGPGLSPRLIGELGGNENVTLTVNQIPQHTHLVNAATGVGHLAEPQAAVPAANRDFPEFDTNTNLSMAPAVQNAGGSQPHENMPPTLCVSFIISLYGIYPTPS